MLPRFRPPLFSYPLFLIILLSIFSQVQFSQNLPKKIRGYKVHRTNVYFLNDGEPNKKRSGVGVRLKFGKPKLSGAYLLGIKFGIDTEITVFGESGRIDSLDFQNVNINGVSVEVDEFTSSFDFKKSKPLRLNEPMKIYVGAVGSLRAALNEITNSEDNWRITGTVFVFGKYKKGPFRFKRFIPVAIDLTIKNPTKEK